VANDLLIVASDSELFAVDNVTRPPTVPTTAKVADISTVAPYSTNHAPIGIEILGPVGVNPVSPYHVDIVGVTFAALPVSVTVTVHFAGDTGKPNGDFALE
jgi:hypothetical protein